MKWTEEQILSLRAIDLWPSACAAAFDLSRPASSNCGPESQRWRKKNDINPKITAAPPPLSPQICCSGMRSAGEGRYLTGCRVSPVGGGDRSQQHPADFWLQDYSPLLCERFVRLFDVFIPTVAPKEARHNKLGAPYRCGCQTAFSSGIHPPQHQHVLPRSTTENLKKTLLFQLRKACWFLDLCFCLYDVFQTRCDVKVRTEQDSCGWHLCGLFSGSTRVRTAVHLSKIL